MLLPKEILEKIEELSSECSKEEILKNFKKISDKYMGEKDGKVLLNQKSEAIAYAISRMPATYNAVTTALRYTLENTKDLSISSCIDVGAGTGAATLALTEILENENINLICLEREEVMAEVGKKFCEVSENENFRKATWIKEDILNNSDNNVTADLVMNSYMLNELAEENVLKVVETLWDKAKKLLLIVDAGTPKDYKRLLKIKEYLVKKGGYVVAPCMGQLGCGIEEGDWCHFLVRVERTKMQKDAKNAEVPYEDEKFTFLAVLKDKNYLENLNENVKRVIRHPIIKTNLVEAKFCTKEGVENLIITKKEKELYKAIKKAKVGDMIK